MGTYESDKKNARTFSLKFYLRTDADIIEHLEQQGNMQAYIKQLIRADIAAHGTPQAVQEDEHETGV